MQMTTLLNRTDGRPDELALIRSEPISMQWTNELRRTIGIYPSCKLLKELLSLDLYTRTVIYPFLIKGWSASRIAARLKVSLITIQKLLEIGREQLKKSWQRPVRIETRLYSPKVSQTLFLKSPANADFTESAIGFTPAVQKLERPHTQRFDGSQDFSNTL
jgi:hypothetical protein